MRLRAPDPPGSLGASALHLGALCAFAFAQPLFDLLGRNAPFFAVRGSDRGDILLFALLLAVVPPLALLAVVALAGLVHRSAGTAVNLLFVAALTGLVFLQAIRGIQTSDALLVAAAGLAGAGGAALYARVRPVRTFLSVLAPAPLVFAALFLFTSPVSRLVTADAPAARIADVRSDTPVVVVVLDELPTASLLDRGGMIDRVRYPNFARLAADAVWFRSATTVHEWTTSAVPALLTGRLPGGDALPLFLDHPRNLFTLLGGSHEVAAVESVTQLCPQELCPRGRGDRWRTLLSDLTVVYPHLLLPDDLRERITPIGDAWSGFRGAGGRPPVYLGRDVQAERFLRSLHRGRRPSLSFLHVLLPHHPWEFLPNGKRYLSGLPWQPGLVDDRWTGDPLLAQQAQQRHLLQVGFVDRLIGRLLDRLEQTGLYDESLVVVTADHGVSFRAPGERRRAEAENLADIAFVPLFLKVPGATGGRVDDRPARLVDVVPTIADALDVSVPWPLEGRSLLGPPRRDERITVATATGELVEAPLDGLVAERNEALAERIRLLGTGSGPPGLFRLGPRPDLLGRPVGEFDVVRHRVATVHLLGGTAYDPSASVVPVHVAGFVHGAGPGEDVAVAVGGRVRAVTRSYAYGDRTWFSAVLPLEAFEPGPNAVRVYFVREEGGRTILAEAPSNGD